MILALGHEAYVGKDTAAIMIIDRLRKKMRNLEVTRVGFADKLYDFCFSVYSWGGFMPRTYYQQNPAAKEILLPRLNKTPRQILIEVGNHMRLYDEDVWVNAATQGNKVKALQIITDLRKQNEFDKIKGIKLKIARAGYQSDRESDVDLRNAPWPYVLHNDGSLKDFNATLEVFVDNVLIPAISGEI